MDLQAALSSNFGHGAFRPCQEDIIRGVLAGKSVLGVLPTGAGKSLCYQLPALLLPRPTLVVSPLIALMKDQLDGLPAGIRPRAALINTSLDAQELESRWRGIEAGEYTLIYAAPERLRQGSFLRLLQRVGLSLMVVDEAHCVSVWGHDFRPDYLFIRRAIESLSAPGPEISSAGPPPTLLALTATATPDMQEEISSQLGRPLEVVTASTYRPNLRLEVLKCSGEEQKIRRVVEFCRETPGAAIIYAASRDRCERLAGILRRQDLPAAHYHAGLERGERQRVQEQFMAGRTRIIVATVAFGMGVDKPDVRLVVHFSMPQSLESYTQEAGRAGRDGLASRCVLLYSSGDKASLSRWMAQEEVSVEMVRDVYRALKGLVPPVPGRRLGSVAPEEVQQIAFREAASSSSTRLRVAISLLEKCGLVTRHSDRGREMSIEILPPPPAAREDLELLLSRRRRHADARLETMVAYAEGPGCRHAAIARHFGQKLKACGKSCDCCQGAHRVTTSKSDRLIDPLWPRRRKK